MPDLYNEETKENLPPVELSKDEIGRLCKKEFLDYVNKEGRFSLDPDEREKGEQERRVHLFWDYARVGSLAAFIMAWLDGRPQFYWPLLVLTVGVYIAGGLIAGKPWFSLRRK